MKRFTLPVKEHLMGLERIKNQTESRLEYLRLDKNENTIGFSQRFIDTARKTINSDFLTVYPQIDSFYIKIARWIGCGKNNIYTSAGSDAAIKAIFEVFVKPRDKVILLSPTYAMFYVYVKMFQAKLIKINYGKDLTLDPARIVKTIESSKPKLVCIANPNSPTGTVISQVWLLRIIKTAKAHNTIALLDEAYHLFYPFSSVSLINRYPNLIITRTFSKAFGLASARIGFACAHKETIKYLQKVRPMYETNAFAVRFGELILDNYDLVKKNLKKTKRAKAYLEKKLCALGIPFLKTHANFILIDVGSLKRAEEIREDLYKHRILIKSGFEGTPLERYVRVTVGDIKQMRIFIRTFQKVYFGKI